MDDRAFEADSAKKRAAWKSVTGAIGLTTTKIVVGVLTGSLGILAEAAHSGLDLVAAAMTVWAVTISGRPPDSSHHYGHGKVENLSALAETLLLLLTCVWIAYEALHRLLFHDVHVDANVWTFAVMALSIGVDLSRSKMLSKAAVRYNSQALEADALHFRSDIWSSAVVIAGLVCVVIADNVPALSWLAKADAIAALFVAGIVVRVTVQLGWRTVQALTDAAPTGIEDRIADVVANLPGIIDCHNVRARYSGPRMFVDVHITVDGSMTLRQAHDLTREVEKAIEEFEPDADVTVHPEPS